jgi:hypothetical protein
MKTLLPIRILFAIGAVYDGLLGLAFLVAPAALFRHFGVTPPNHFGYVQFPAAILMIFALMFAAVAREPVRNRNLIPFGMLLKVSYCGVVFSYWFSTGLPDIWKPFAVADLAFLILFGWALAKVKAASSH